MAKKIELSIIIVNFNTYRFLHFCLDSIYQGNLPQSSCEIIVVDNASADDSVNSLRKNYPQVKLITNRQNLGFARANNQGIKKASGNLLLLLNPDTIVPKKTLKRMLEFVKKEKKAGIATCRVELPSGELDDACHRGFPTPWRSFCQFSSLAAVFPQSQFFNGYHLGYKDMDKVHEIDSCVGAFMLIKREVITSVGNLDEDYFWYGEDLDFCYRAKKRGWQIIYVPDVKIIHYKGVAAGIKKHSLQISTADKKVQLLATKSRFEAMRIFYDKHYKKVYPSWLTTLVLTGINLKKELSLIKLKLIIK